MDIAIIGAGFAGIATARVLLRLGHRVTIFEAMPDVGGVWSSRRNYPLLVTQNPASTYHLSEMPWPAGTPDFPSGTEVQAYLEAYVRHFDIAKHVQLHTEVVTAVQTPHGQWVLTLRPTLPITGETQPSAPTSRRTFDQLVVCNGVFSEPFVPEFAGRDVFDAAGGRVIHSSQFRTTDVVADNTDVLVVGFGKSACDVAVAASTVKATRSTTVVARRITWKLPRVLMNVVPYQLLLLTRLGEALFRFKAPGFFSRVLTGALSFVRNGMLDSLGWVAKSQYDLSSIGLVPRGPFETIACADISLVTEGFFEGVKDGSISVAREAHVVSLGPSATGTPCAILSDGTTRPANLIVAGTGWRQRVPFLPAEIVKSITDDRGNYVLYRFIQPPKVANLYFNGYNSSLFCPTSAEVAALWIAAAIEGRLDLPPTNVREQDAKEFVSWLDARGLNHEHATSQVPWSLAIIDTVLADLDAGVSLPSYILQWLLPVSPSSYQPVVESVIARLLAARTGH